MPEGVPKPGRFSRGVDANLVPGYLSERYREHPRANPGLEDPKHIHPKAELFVVLTSQDTLVKQSEAWLSQLREEGLANRVEVFRPEGMGHGYVNFPERMLDRKGFKRKREAYAAMNRFWDRVVAESGHPMANGGHH